LIHRFFFVFVGFFSTFFCLTKEKITLKILFFFVFVIQKEFFFRKQEIVVTKTISHTASRKKKKKDGRPKDAVPN